MILIYSHGGFGWFELCLQLWFCGTTDGIIMSHPQGEMIGLLPESHKNQDASVANKNPWTCENPSEIPCEKSEEICPWRFIDGKISK